MSETEQPQGGDVPTREEGDASTAMSEPERELYGRFFANTVDWPTEFRSALDQTIRALLTAGNVAGLASRIWAPGDWKMIIEDLTANTAEYVYTDVVGSWVYLNGATVSRTTYSLLFAKLGVTFGAGDGSTTFGLPDTRGRSIWTCGTNAALDLGDNDGVAEGSRQPKHTHTFTPSGGSAAASGHTHTTPSHGHGVSFGTSSVQSGSGAAPLFSLAVNSGGAGTTGAASGVASLSGTVGTGMAGADAVAHIALGSIVAFIG